jgi:hypothetical protein
MQKQLKIFWKNIPIEIIQKIVEYSGKIKMRNKKFMNQIENIEDRYHLLRLRLCFDKDREYNNVVRLSHVNIPIPFTDKSLYYFAFHRGMRITLHTDESVTGPNINKCSNAEILYSNIAE